MAGEAEPQSRPSLCLMIRLVSMPGHCRLPEPHLNRAPELPVAAHPLRDLRLREPLHLEPARLLPVVVRPGAMVVLDPVVRAGSLARRRGLVGER